MLKAKRKLGRRVMAYLLSLTLIFTTSLVALTQTTYAAPVTLTHNYNGVIETWQVPQTGTYTITAYGASGGSLTQGSTTKLGGKGAKMQGDFTLYQGEVINILVGQQGNNSSGGGGTFVSNYSTPLLVAGGGGGTGGHDNANTSPRTYAFMNGLDASTLNNGTAGGTTGSYGSGGGGGYFGNGAGNGGGKSFASGGTGGAGNNAAYLTLYTGGFGGGGAGSLSTGWSGSMTYGCFGGGGGGYSGGNGGNDAFSNSAGTGGGSYNAGSSSSNSIRTDAGDGYVTITYTPNSGANGSGSQSGYPPIFTVVQNVPFTKYMYGELSGGTVNGVTSTPSTGSGYTKLSGTLGTVGPVTATFGGTMILFNVIAAPTDSYTATVNFSS